MSPGFVEGPRFYPYLSGRRNLRLLADYDEPISRSRIDEVLELVELRDRAKDRVGGYSHGMRQRLGIAASLLRSRGCCCSTSRRPGSTRPGCATCATSSAGSPSEGITILLSSHLLYEVEELCNRVAIIRKGSIVYQGTLGELLATAATGYRLKTREPERGAKALCLNQRGIENVVADGDELCFSADEDAVAALSVALGQARIPILQLVDRDREPRGSLPRHDRRRVERSRPARGGGGVMTAVARIYKWEVAKLLAQKRTYLGLGAAMIVPVIFVVVLQIQSGGPNDVPLGRYIRDSGIVTPLVVLLFMSIWGFPLITALVAGDIVASETHNGTLKTILTRSRERGQVFAGKALATFTYTLAIVVAMGVVGVAAGSIAWGFHSFTSLSGTPVSRRARARPDVREPRGLRAAARRHRRLRAAPLDGHAQLGRVGRRHAHVRALHAADRRAAGHREHPAVSARDAVRRLARLPPHAGGLGDQSIRAIWLSAIYIVVPLFAAYLVFLRRDVAGD